jgi:putative tryptophan/tyrosine transport system substrate-binding protein
VRRRELLALVGCAATLPPLAGYAQQKPMPVIGYLTVTSVGAGAEAFRRGLGETGYVEGQNLTVEYRAAEGHYDRLPAMAADLVGRKVDLLAAGGPPAARAAKDATSAIPIVFVVGSDPVKEGLVASLARPGGNLTGFSILARDLASKRLELLTELVPQVKAIALLVNPYNAAEELVVSDLQEAARAKGFQLAILKAGTEGEIDAAFAVLVQSRAGALLVGNDSFLTSRREQIVELASRAAVPAIYAFRDFAASGGLISFGANSIAAWRQAGIYSGRILKGAKPADLPVQQPTTFELVINLKTAKTLGLTVPPSILARADEVIE